MTRRRLHAWAWFVAASLLLLAALVWVTAALVRLDRDEVDARRQALRHERMRLALWRMDSWLAPQLAHEALRPPQDYQAFPPGDEAWTVGDSRLRPGQVRVLSPLLGFESPRLVLHFEVGADGAVRSPQVPLSDQRDVAEANGIAADVLERARLRLEQLTPALRWAALERGLRGAEAQLPSPVYDAQPLASGLQLQQSNAEFNSRAQVNAVTVENFRHASRAKAPMLLTGIGPMLPFWLGADGATLAVCRRVTDTTGARIQGVVLDWNVLQRELGELVADLFPPGDVRLVRCPRPIPAEQPSMLASVPARLEVGTLPEVIASGLPTAAILAITWGVVLLGLLGLGFTLRAAIGFGERRARFASAVTHELRTPLTTFRMYSEMLADGVVREPAAQQEYLRTLQRESDRLARVVENVLAWSRLEEGRFASRREPHRLGALLAGIEPVLRRRLDEAGMSLRVDVDADTATTALTTDADAVGQILFNLVDNAAKYARQDGGEVELQARRGGAGVRISVRDRGPGIALAHRLRVFAPFDRGALATGHNDAPGTGLGLPLARGLARDLGGDLALDAVDAPGARFVLTLPA